MEWAKVREVMGNEDVKQIIQDWYDEQLWEKEDVEAYNLAMEKLGLPKVEIEFVEEDEDDDEEDANLRPDPAKIDYCTPCTYKSCTGCEVPNIQRTKK